MERYSTREEAEAIHAIYLDRSLRQSGRLTQSSGACYGTPSPLSAADEAGVVNRTRTLPPLHTRGCMCTDCYECERGFMTHTDSELAQRHIANSGREDLQGVESAPEASPFQPPPPPPSAQSSTGHDPVTERAEDEQGKEKEDPIPKGWRMYIHNFTTPWFTINMGTGLLSILLYRVPPPYSAHWLRILGITLFILNLALFILFSVIMTLRVFLFPSIPAKIMKCEKESLFLGAWVMGLATLVNMFVYVCVQDGRWGGWLPLSGVGEGRGGGGWALDVAWAAFWVCVVGSAGTVCLVPFLVMTLHPHPLPSISGAFLMPTLPPIVVAGTGSILTSALLPSSPTHALWTLITSLILLGLGLPLALSIIVILFARLVLGERVPGEEVVSLMIPVGPLGTGGFAAMGLGMASLETLGRTGSVLGRGSGEVVYVAGLVAALLMWGYGIFWLTLAVGTMVYQRTFPFNMGWWSFIFPFGVFTLSTYQIGNEIPSKFFKIVGLVFLAILTLLWIMDVGNTIYHTYTGKIFSAPWLKKPPTGMQKQAREERHAKKRQHVEG